MNLIGKQPNLQWQVIASWDT